MLVKVKNTIWPKRHLYFFPMEPFHEYQGEEVKVKWVSDQELALSTNIPGFAFRVIKKENIVAIDGKPYKFESTPKEKIKVRIVEGSNGKEYEVTGNYKCTCPGFTFRGDCKHIKEPA
jgi:hypothetical protein